MNMFSGFILFLIFAVPEILSESNVARKFRENDITPQIISEAPTSPASVRYSTGVEANLGNELSPLLLAQEPTVSWNAQRGNYYCIVMFDPDVPSKQSALLRSLIHWMVVNIPEDQVNKGNELAFYLLPTPPFGSGDHRYIFVVFLQPGKLESDEVRILTDSTVDRIKFDVEAFVEKYNLKPVAGNFYLAHTVTRSSVI